MLKKIIRHKAVGIISLVSLAFAAGGSLWAYLVVRGTADTPLILHFDDLAGITAVGTSSQLAVAGALGIFVVVMNFFIALELEAHDRFLGKLTAALTLLFAILLFIAFAAIINVN